MMSISRVGVVLFTVVFALFVSGCGPEVGNKLESSTERDKQVTASSPAATPAGPRAKLNLNTASASELLAAIPGFGNRMVHEFEEYRPYRSIQQFRREIGKYVKPEQVTEYEKYVFVPINENDADAPTLQQIPGLEAAEAEKLIGGRPYASREAFLTKLAEYVTPADLEIAKTYLSTP